MHPHRRRMEFFDVLDIKIYMFREEELREKLP
jgi:hypothetical protein